MAGAAGSSAGPGAAGGSAAAIAPGKQSPATPARTRYWPRRFNADPFPTVRPRRCPRRNNRRVLGHGVSQHGTSGGLYPHTSCRVTALGRIQPGRKPGADGSGTDLTSPPTNASSSTAPAGSQRKRRTKSSMPSCGCSANHGAGWCGSSLSKPAIRRSSHASATGSTSTIMDSALVFSSLSSSSWRSSFRNDEASAVRMSRS